MAAAANQCAASLARTPVHDTRAYVIDLCQHGDVHPNPGPDHYPVPYWSCNVGRGAGSWEFFQLGRDAGFSYYGHARDRVEGTGKEQERLALELHADRHTGRSVLPLLNATSRHGAV